MPAKHIGIIKLLDDATAAPLVTIAHRTQVAVPANALPPFFNRFRHCFPLWVLEDFICEHLSFAMGKQKGGSCSGSALRIFKRRLRVPCAIRRRLPARSAGANRPPSRAGQGPSSSF